MGSRAVVVVCRDEEAARERFGVAGDEHRHRATRAPAGGSSTTRRWRAAVPRPRARRRSTRAGFWDELETDWVCLDCELMPWSAKAQELLRQQYAAVGAAARRRCAEAVAALRAGRRRDGVDSRTTLLEPLPRRAQDTASGYVDAYRRYCWPVDVARRPEAGAVPPAGHRGRASTSTRTTSGTWRRWPSSAAADPELLLATPYQVVDLTDPASEAAGIAWWEELTGARRRRHGREAARFVARGRRGLVQPAVKCRGREYLRIIYGPEYTAPEHLERLRERGCRQSGRSPSREFALGIEALERFVRREPLRRVHECVFGVLALEKRAGRSAPLTRACSLESVARRRGSNHPTPRTPRAPRRANFFSSWCP